jgi:hypothetical protein
MSHPYCTSWLADEATRRAANPALSSHHRSCIRDNKEPFAHKAWRKEPYEPRPYMELRDYAITSNVQAEVSLQLAGLVAWGRTEGRDGGRGPA